MALTGLVGCGIIPPESPAAGSLTVPSASPGATSSPRATTAAATPSPSGTAATPQPSPIVPPLPTPAKLKAALGKVSAKGIAATGIVVMDPASATVLTSRGDVPMTPASTMKVLTALAVLDTLGADHRFTTRVVTASDGHLVLVGGGDPYLTDKKSSKAFEAASLQELAEATAAALPERGGSLVLDWDTTLFTGPSWNPHWPKPWQAVYPKVTALSVNNGRKSQYVAHPNPPKAAAEAFANQLKAVGVTVKLGTSRTAGKAEAVAAVQSAPLTEVIGAVLRYSNNVGADILARQMALGSGADPSFTGAGKAVAGWLKQRGWWADGMVIDDGSGLSKQSKVSPSVLAKAISGMLITPSLAGVGQGFPVAGKNGTLKKRFDDPQEAAGRGRVHAKTGTLAGVASLAGYVETKDGAVLVFAAMANQAVGQTTAYNWLDRTAAVLAGCGCR